MARVVLEELSSALASPKKLTVPSQTHAVTAGDSSEMEAGAGERTLDCMSDDSFAVYKATAWLIPCTSCCISIFRQGRDYILRYRSRRSERIAVRKEELCSCFNPKYPENKRTN